MKIHGRGYPPPDSAEHIRTSEQNDPEGAKVSPNSIGSANTVYPPLAFFCPTCPQPGINLPDGWDKDPKWWLYIRKFCADGNFKADHLNQINQGADVSLTNGEGFMTAPEAYDHHIKEAVSKANRYNHVSLPEYPECCRDSTERLGEASAKIINMFGPLGVST